MLLSGISLGAAPDGSTPSGVSKKEVFMSNPIVKRSSSVPSNPSSSREPMQQNATPCNTFSNVSEDPLTWSKEDASGQRMTPNPETDGQPYRRGAPPLCRPRGVAGRRGRESCPPP